MRLIHPDHGPPASDDAWPEQRRGRSKQPVVAVVTRSGDIPPLPRTRGHGVLLLTCAATPADAVRLARDTLGEDSVIECGGENVDPRSAARALADKGLPRILCEGGPHLMHDVVSSGMLDELCLTLTPMLIGCVHPRILAGAPVDAELRLGHLIESHGSLLGRWVVRRG